MQAVGWMYGMTGDIWLFRPCGWFFWFRMQRINQCKNVGYVEESPVGGPIWSRMEIDPVLSSLVFGFGNHRRTPIVQNAH